MQFKLAESNGYCVRTEVMESGKAKMYATLIVIITRDERERLFIVADAIRDPCWW